LLQITAARYQVVRDRGGVSGEWFCSRYRRIYLRRLYRGSSKTCTLTVSLCRHVLSCRSYRPPETAGKLLIEAFSAPPPFPHPNAGVKSDRRGFEGSIQAQRKWTFRYDHARTRLETGGGVGACPGRTLMETAHELASCLLCGARQKNLDGH
jgi:hypothetical protein